MKEHHSHGTLPGGKTAQSSQLFSIHGPVQSSPVVFKVWSLDQQPQQKCKM